MNQEPTSSKPLTKESKPLTKEEVLQYERQRILERRRRAFPKSIQSSDGDKPADVVGLALSGGGLRSAMFNDGFLQGLSHRGLLRYVDYLCSVSGGGYTASHLATRLKDDGADSFHDCPAPSQAVSGTNKTDGIDEASDAQAGDWRSWHLGRDPDTGKFDSERLKGVGRYLVDSYAIAASYIVGLLTHVCIYLGVGGVVATVIALFWRSFDNPDFRFVYESVLEFRFGSELLVAFIPTLLIGVVWIALLVFRIVAIRWPNKGLLGFLDPKTMDRRLGLVAILIGIAMVISIAVFAGNGKTTYREGDSVIFLNHYTQNLVLFAAVVQALAFLGRDKLFKSEKSEAKNWQKMAQKVATFSVVGLFMIAFVHFMAAEDISNYTRHRSAYLVRGDVLDWQRLERVFVGFQTQEGGNPSKPHATVIDQRLAMKNAQLSPIGDWDRHVQNRLFPFNRSELRSQPTPPNSNLPSKNALGKLDRLLGAFEGYIYAQGVPISSSSEVSTHLKKYRNAKPAQEGLLATWNTSLDKPEFTEFLIELAGDAVGTGVKIKSAGVKAESDGVDKQPGEKKSEAGHKNFMANGVTPMEQASLQSLAEELHDLNLALDVEPWRDGNNNVVRRHKRSSLNRLLLQAQFPGAVQSSEVASTLVVPPYDQQARWSWLASWLLLLGVGLFLSRLRGALPSGYNFYRHRLEQCFHRQPGQEESAQQPVATLDPTNEGLPYPLFLAARLSGNTETTSYKVDNEPFVFSPKYCGDLDGKLYETSRLRLLGTTQRSGPKNRKVDALTVGDAVTLSGAAVSPLMSDNRYLSLIFSFFGAGLGRWIETRTDDTNWNSNSKVFVWLCVFSLIPLSLLFLLAGCYTYASVAILSLMVVGYAVFSPSGITLLLRSLFIGDPVSESDSLVGYVADGGFYDYLGISELLRRECSMIIVSDAGAHLNDDSLAPLAKLCETAASEMGIRILDLDHEAPLDFRRLEIDQKKLKEDKGNRLAHQPFICARIRYPGDNQCEGILIYCQMAITEDDPLEIQQIRNRFPSFPDEPTTNQFYTDEQVAAYRNLGYHIAGRMCREMHRWTGEEIFTQSAGVQRKQLDPSDPPPFVYSTTDSAAKKISQPLFSAVRRRLDISFRLACYQEDTYRKDDLFSEAVWAINESTAPSATHCYRDILAKSKRYLRKLKTYENSRPDAVSTTGDELDEHLFSMIVERSIDGWNVAVRELCDHWVSCYERNGDIREIYRKAVVTDINSIDDNVDSACAEVFRGLCNQNQTENECQPKIIEELLLASHIAAISLTCHELHQGRPHESFQVGGREKLLNLAQSLSYEISSGLYDDSSNVRRRCKKLVGELLEMKKCVFHGAQQLTTVSVAQCMVGMWGRLSHDRWHQEMFAHRVDMTATPNPQAPVQTLINEIQSQGCEMASLQTRVWINDSLENDKINIDKLVRALEKGWCVAYFGEEIQKAEEKYDSSNKKKKRKKTKVSNQGING